MTATLIPAGTVTVEPAFAIDQWESVTCASHEGSVRRTAASLVTVRTVAVSEFRGQTVATQSYHCNDCVAAGRHL